MRVLALVPGERLTTPLGLGGNAPFVFFDAAAAGAAVSKFRHFPAPPASALSS
jgi:hypothetical protein